MATVAFFFVFVVIVLVKNAAQQGKGAAAEFDRLLAKGAPARGILLHVSNQGFAAPGRAGTRRFQRRRILLDVEVLGEAPYETTTTPLIPSNLVGDILPGATVELRVDRKNRDTIAIVGPGVGMPAPGLTPGTT